MPQARLLEFLAAEAGRYATFQLVRGAQVDRLIEAQGVISGVTYDKKEAPVQ